MPVNIPRALPARRTLESENVFVMSETRAGHQDIRPLRIAIVNLMPTKVDTETQLLRLLGNTPLQVQITLLRMDSHESNNTTPGAPGRVLRHLRPGAGPEIRRPDRHRSARSSCWHSRRSTTGRNCAR